MPKLFEYNENGTSEDRNGEVERCVARFESQAVPIHTLDNTTIDSITRRIANNNRRRRL